MADRANREIKAEVRHVPEPETSAKTPEADVSEVVQLQRYLGNQGIQRLMKTGRLRLSGSNVLQAKLTVTPAGDQYEQEADRVAKQVVNGPDPASVQRAGEEDEMALKREAIQRGPIQGAGDQYEQEPDQVANQASSGESASVKSAGQEDEIALKRDTIQRAGEEDEMALKRDIVQRAGEEDEMALKRDIVQRAGEEDEMALKRDTIQRAGEEDEMALKRDDPAAGFDVGGDLEQTIQSQRGGGQALPSQAKGFFENGFGQDFSGVHIHADKQADSLNQAVSARAFTVGSDIFFRSGEYDPSGQAGKELLAHELTHVVQQGGSKVQKKEDDAR